MIRILPKCDKIVTMSFNSNNFNNFPLQSRYNFSDCWFPVRSLD